MDEERGSNPAVTGLLLAGLPSRGLFSSTVLSSNLGGMRVYVCDRDTSPPEGQQIKTNQTNILIRSLQLKGQKGSSSSKDGKGAATTDVSRKRSLERPVEGRALAKRNSSQNVSKPEMAESSSSSTKDFYSLTVEKLRALLKERGLSPKGKKDELVARLKSAHGQ